MLDHGLAAAAAKPDLITSDARDLILRVTRGIPRLISHLLRISLALADERGQTSIDVSVVNTATIVLHLESPKPPSHAPAQTPLRARREITGITRPDTTIRARPLIIAAAPPLRPV